MTVLQLRREGMRLFLVWYQILMNNATDECHTIYTSLVPKLAQTAGTAHDIDIFTKTVPDGKPLYSMFQLI